MSAKASVRIGVPTDYTTLSVEINNSKCDILVIELQTNNLLIVTVGVDCGSMKLDLDWSEDCFDHGTALTIVQAAVYTRYTETGWKFVNSQIVPDLSESSHYLATFTFVR